MGRMTDICHVPDEANRCVRPDVEGQPGARGQPRRRSAGCERSGGHRGPAGCERSGGRRWLGGCRRSSGCERPDADGQVLTAGRSESAGFGRVSAGG